MNEFTMLIGHPCAGKSTWSVKNFNGIIVSSDNYIQAKADLEGKTYSDVFEQYVKEAQQACFDTASAAYANGQNVCWDQTNCSPSKRIHLLSKVPKGYFKRAVVFYCHDLSEVERRNAARPGKVIPWNIIMNMRKALYSQGVWFTEGFDQIDIVRTG